MKLMAKKQKLVLFVEDDLPTIDVYRTALEKAGFDVDPILLGEEAIRRFEEVEKGEAKMPDLVLLDLILPDMNGIEVLERIRAKEKIKDIKVLILTNYTDKQLEEKGLKMKAEKYLLKTDYTPSQLVKIVKETIRS